MENNNFFNKIICGEIKMVRSNIAQKYQADRQSDKEKLRIDIMTVAKLTDPIYITPNNEIIDGWKRLEILKELYDDNFRLVVYPTVIIVETAEQQEEIYISKNVMVNRYKKSWLAIIAAENILPGNRRIAQARRGIRQEEKFDACVASGTAFGISGKLVQQADEILKSQHGFFLREKIRIEELTVTHAYEIVTRELDSIINDMKSGKTYKAARNSFLRDAQATRQHEKYQKREDFKENNLLEYQKNTPDASESLSVPEASPSPAPNQLTAPVLTVQVQQAVQKPVQAATVSKQTHFVGALSACCSVEFREELALLMKKYMPNSHVVFIQDRLKLQQLVHENNLEYEDYVEAA